MKIFILKLLSLLVLILGLVSLCIAIGVPQVQEYLGQVPALLTDLQGKLPEQLDVLKGMLTVQSLWFGGSVVAIVLGAYGFWPKGKKFRRRKKIAYEGPHGEVQIQLDTVEQSLNQVLARMPEIKKIELRVDPQAGGRKALIRADVVIYQQPGQSARAIAALVSDYIAETATKLLGLEELATIDLNVTGISVNTRKSSKAIRKESLSHSGNAPVELLEAAPAPLTLSGPGEPLGSESIEEELEEEEAESAMETSAVDTRRDEANQAAARSELLEPLHMNESAQTPDESSAEPASAEEEQAQEDVVAPLDMDVLDETLEDTAEYFEDGAESASNEAGDSESSDESDEALADASDVDAGTDDTDGAATSYGDAARDGEVEPAFDVAVALDAAEPIQDPDDSETSSEESEATPLAYPWESAAAEATEEESAPEASEESESDRADAEEDADVPVTNSYESSDSVMGDMPEDVTIPDTEEAESEGEANPSEEPAESTEKKRWGSWFN